MVPDRRLIIRAVLRDTRQSTALLENFTAPALTGICRAPAHPRAAPVARSFLQPHPHGGGHPRISGARFPAFNEFTSERSKSPMSYLMA